MGPTRKSPRNLFLGQTTRANLGKHAQLIQDTVDAMTPGTKKLSLGMARKWTILAEKICLTRPEGTSEREMAKIALEEVKRMAKGDMVLIAALTKLVDRMT